jgi:hypothetical protein
MIISKKQIVHIIAIVWVIFSVAYICYDIWSDFRANQLSLAYQQGRVDTVNALISQAQACNAIPVSSATTTIEVVNVKCLQTQSEK